MPYTPALIIGNSHDGLAMSHSLDEHEIEHTLLERREYAETPVRSLRRMGGGFPGWEVCTDDELWFARTVVIVADPCAGADLPEDAGERRPRYPWLKERVLDERGEIRHDGGIVDAAKGLYVLGLPATSDSQSLDGDVTDIAVELCSHLDRVPLVV